MPDFATSTRSKEFLENLIDAVREPLVVLDQDLRVLSVSRAFYDVFRTRPKETIGQRIYDLGNRQWDIPQLRHLLESIVPEKTSFKDYEVVHTFSSIGQRTMLLNARQIRRTFGKTFGKNKIILLAIEDITTRKEIESSLETARRELATRKVAEDDAREFAQSIIDTIREPLLALDQNLTIVAASRAFYDVFHVEAEQTVGQRIFELGDGQWDIPRLRELLDAILLQSTTFNDYEVVHDFSTIGRRTMMLNARQIKRSLGKERTILLAIEDVTDRKRMEEELQKNQRVESLGILAGGIAHDFNNLMAGLLANTELARVHLLAGQTALALQRLEKTPAIFARGRVLTRRLLTFSKGGSPARLTMDLGPLIREWVDFALMGSVVTAVLQVDPHLWLCDCDVGQVGQVLNNLLINARQASPEAGVITVKASNEFKLGRYVCVRVTNGGPCIPPEIIGRIFDPFFTTKVEGSGLGLAIAFSIVRQHNGWIDVTSNPTAGTTLSVFLPASEDCACVDEPVCAEGEYQDSGIAVVMDDDPDILDAVGEMVAGTGLEVARAKNGAEVLAAYRDFLHRGLGVKVFLLDNQVPGGIGGLATAQLLRELGSKAKIVIMSGHFGAMPPPGPGPDGLWRLGKPFTKDELTKVLGLALGEAG